MKEMKRIISMVLCLVMILSLLPVGAVRVNAAETIETGNVVDAAIVFSDLHTNNKSKDESTNYKKSNVEGIMNAFKNTGLPFTSVTSCGDAFSVNEDSKAANNNGPYGGYTSIITGYIRNGLGDSSVDVNYVWSDHDRYAYQEDGTTLLDKTSYLAYEGNYYVYALSMGDLCSYDRYKAGFNYSSTNNSGRVAAGFTATVPKAIQNFKDTVAKLDKTKPLLIASHQPLFDNRNDNAWAELWFEAINEVAAEMDVVFFFGHNHNYDNAADYYYAKGSQMPVALDDNWNYNYEVGVGYKPSVNLSSSKQTLNFTHMCAGYLEPTSTGSYDKTATRRETAIAVTIYEDYIGLTTYNASGKYTGNYAVNELVKRDHAPEDVPEQDPTLESIAITKLPTKLTYKVDETVELAGMEVTATYSDGKTTVITENEYSVDNVDMTTPGTKKVGVSCTMNENTVWAYFDITVVADEEPKVEEKTFISKDNFAAVTATATGATLAEVEENAKADELLEYWYGYDISLEGQVADTSVTVKLWLDPDAMTSENLAVYYVNENGELEAVTGYAVAVDEENVEYITISDAALGTYIYGTPKVIESEGAKLVSLKLTPPTKTAYFDSDVKDKPVMVIAENGEQEETVEKVIYLDITGLEVIAVYDDGTEKEIQWNQFDESADGFALTFDALVVDGQVQYGKKTVTVTYVDGKETATATFSVNVCRESITVEEVTIKFDTPSVESLTVEIPETVDEVIANAVMEVIDGDVTVYDIKPVYAEGFDKLQGTATVTLPLPEGLTNPVVYYVSDDGAIVDKMDAQVVDGKLVFTTDHFSKYVVGEDGTVGVEDENQTSEPKDLYILVDKIDEEGDYLLVNTNAASANAVLLKASSNNKNVETITNVVVKSGVRADNSANIIYIEAPDATAIWNAVASGTQYKLYNSETGLYLRRNNNNLRSTDSSYSATTWTTSKNNAVYYDTTPDKYIVYDQTWKVANSGTVYIYKLFEDVSVTETQYGGTYSIVGAANPATNVPALTGQTVALSNTVYFQSKLPGSTAVVQTPVANGTVTYTFVDASGNPVTENTIGTISGNTLTLNGTVGTGTIRVTYSWTEDGETYQLYDDFTVTTKAPVYHVTLKKGNAIVTGDITASFVADGDSLGLTAELGADLANAVPANIQPTWTLEMTEGAAAIIDINDLTYTGESGTANLTCTYTWTDANDVVQTVSETVTITTTGERSEIIFVEVKDGTPGTTEVKTLAVKGVTNTTTRVLAALVTEYTSENPNGAAVNNPVIKWEIESDNSGIFDADAGLTLGSSTGNTVEGTGNVTLNFSGKGGMATLRATLADGTTHVVTVNAAKTSYYTPEDGTNDFPDYPNPGAVVIDKTATPVGDFNQTGTALVELNMFGIPAGTGVDVIVMLDTSSSMDKCISCGNYTSIYTNDKSDACSCTNPTTRIDELKVALQKLEDALKASPNASNIRIAVTDFNGMYTSGPVAYDNAADTNDKSGLTDGGVTQVYTNKSSAALDIGAFVTANDLDVSEFNFDGDCAQTGTNYDYGFDAIYQLGYAVKQENIRTGDTDRQLVVLFMTDGAPNQYNFYRTTGGSGGSTYWNYWLQGTIHEQTRSASQMFDSWSTYGHYYNEPLNEHRMAVAIKGDPNQRYTVIRKNYDGLNQTVQQKAEGTNMYTLPGLGATMYAIAFRVAADGNITADSAKTALQRVPSADGAYIDAANQAQLEEAFQQIGAKIADAATDVAVNDLIAPSYSMTFEFPQGVDTESVPEDHEFYIEVVNYPLDADFERTGASESLIRVYMNEDGTFRAAHVTVDENGAESVIDVDTTYAAKQDGEKGYFTSAGVYVPDGTGTHNITSGVYYSGTPSMDDDTDSANSLILVTPHFTYKADGQVLDWTTDKLAKDSQIALRYFVYLNGSADKVSGDASVEGQLHPGVYETNTKATVTYINHLGNECVQTFPVPQLTWSGAQVGVSFYLVNAQGQPINRSGEVVPLAAATFVTKTFYESVIWNTEKTDPLRASFLAKEYLPEEYSLYDENASYMIHVYKDEDGNIYDDFFEIGGTETVKTTYVYNNINGIKYNNYGVYSGTIGQGQMVDYQEKQEDESYVNKTKPVDFNTGSTIDYSSTNVAFAVVWIPTLAEDTIVVDFGLPVAINVTQNDQLDNTVNSIGTRITSNDYEMNTGVSNKSIIGLAEGSSRNGDTLILADGNRVTMYNGILYFTQGDMIFDDPSVFYYDSKVSYTNSNNVLVEGYMYSKVTVIPATTVYYEDSYVTLSSYVKDENGAFVKSNESGWVKVQDSETVKDNVVQGTDRPGPDKFHLTGYDADNIYGFDAAYSSYSTYSLGSAAKVSVNDSKYGTARFTFYGTGFDLISLTSNTTGTITAKVYDESGKNVVRNILVDTYYGYTYKNDEWKPVTSGDNAIYQVPVVTVQDLPYGKYNVLITVSYSDAFDHNTSAAGYDFYLDAIRVYDPIAPEKVVDDKGNEDTADDVTVGDIYAKDGEAYPEYYEVRNIIINASMVYTKVEIEEFEEGVTYYTENKGIYSEVKPFFDENATYYTAEQNGNQEVVYTQVEIEAFAEDVTYYTKNTDDTYSKVEPVFDEKATYYVYAQKIVDGAVFIDGKGQTAALADYISFGPNNEVYLDKGQSIAFGVNAPAKNGYKTKVQIGWKSTDGTVKLSYVDKNKDVKTATERELATATDMYYDITDLNGKTILITNTGSGIISITNVKFSYEKVNASSGGSSSSGSGSEVAEEAISPFTVRMEDIEVILAYLRKPVVEEIVPEIPEVTEPEATEPEVTEPEVTEPEATEPETEPTKPSKPGKIDSAELKAAVEAAKKLKEKDYTKESFKALDKAIKSAEKILKDKKATQEKIDEALAALNEAVEVLETNAPATKPGKEEKPEKDTKPGKDKKPADSKPGKPENNNQNKPANNKAPAAVETAQKVADIVGAIAEALFGWMFR